MNKIKGVFGKNDDETSKS